MTTVRLTRRWRGIVAVALFATAVGVLAKRPLVLLSGVVGVAYVAYPHLTGTPTVDLSIDRTVSDSSPGPGEEVEVSVTVRNEGDRTLWDVRLVDGVPPMLTVVGGRPRHAAVLRPGASTTFSYTLRTTYGRHGFEPTTAIVRDPSGATEVETSIPSETEISCSPAVPEAPLRRWAGRFAGPIETDDGGSGVEFHGVREYRYGDPIERVDWRRFARSNDLVTVEFREERRASVVLCIDGRPAAYRGRPDEPHGAAYCVAAAESLLESLLDSRADAGVTAVSPEPPWLPPGAGIGHAERAKRLLATHPAFSTTPPDGEVPGAEETANELRARLDADTQVILLSPLLDGHPTTVASTLEAAGHPVTVVSPDVAGEDTIGGRLAALERGGRIASLRHAGVAVIDWPTDEPLGATVIRARGSA